MRPKCWRCRGFLELRTDGDGILFESCPHCAAYVAELEAWIRKQRGQRNRWNRGHYARHREREVARVSRWRAANREKDRAASLRYYRRHRDAINRRRRERARLAKRKAE